MSKESPATKCESAAKVSPQEPDLLVPWREIEATCKRIMKESEELHADSKDYRIGQWSGADKVLFALDCVAERLRISALSETLPSVPAGMEFPERNDHPLTSGDLAWQRMTHAEHMKYAKDEAPVSATLPSAWIPVSKERPAFDPQADDVLTTTITGHVVTAHPNRISSLYLDALQHGEECFYTHWMALPEAAK